MKKYIVQLISKNIKQGIIISAIIGIVEILFLSNKIAENRKENKKKKKKKKKENNTENKIKEEGSKIEEKKGGNIKEENYK